MKRLDVDVVVVGAGVAGLAAAREMRRAAPTRELLVLEARNRIGGRILTVRDPGTAVPIELGAEFVHGKAAETIALAEERALTLCDVEGERWSARDGRLTRLHDFWHRLDKVMRRLDAKRSPDRSFRDFIESRPGGAALAGARTLALEFVQGFHAADVARISERSLAEGGSPGEDPAEQRLARILDGYDQVPHALASDLGDRVRLGAVVSRVTWRRGEVRLAVRLEDQPQIDVRARAAIITVPLGVLLASRREHGAIAFDPPIDEFMSAARGLTMGSILRIVLAMRARFWEDQNLFDLPDGKTLSMLSFLHTRDPDVPVWWTTQPVRVPLLVGWAGGPRAERLLQHPRADIERIAVASLARQLGLSERRIRSQLEQSWMHDWEHDPFARGAYSYILVGGMAAPRRLARPIEATLFFAGEAADAQGRMGTVNGAIASGVRAAKACLRQA